jgi:hypothetical protein
MQRQLPAATAAPTTVATMAMTRQLQEWAAGRARLKGLSKYAAPLAVVPVLLPAPALLTLAQYVVHKRSAPCLSCVLLPAPVLRTHAQYVVPGKCRVGGVRVLMCCAMAVSVAAADMCPALFLWLLQPPPRMPAVSKERSRVRSNRMGGSSRQCESSVCSDNSASSIDNPSYIAAAAAAAAAAGGAGELGPDADGVSLLLHMGQAAAAQHAAVSTAAGRRGSYGGRGAAGRGSGGGGRSSSCAASAVGGTGGHSTAKSAAGILLSLSASQSDAL